MNDFPTLLEDLLLSSSKKKKISLLVNYFHKSEIKEKGWAFFLLTNRMQRKYLNSRDLKEIVIKRVGEPLFKYSYDYVGDLAETISLLWKKKKDKKTNFKLSEFMEYLSNNKNKEELKKKLEILFDESNEQQRFCYLKILTGGFRVGVSNGLIKEALVKYGCREADEIDELWHGFIAPYKDLFSWLEGKSLPSYVDKKYLFNSLMLANNFIMKNFTSLNTNNFSSEFKWDGIRAQIIFAKYGKIFSRNGEDITKSFPDLHICHKNYYVIDGEIVIKKANKILSFNDLQKRIGRKTTSKKLLIDYPAHFIAYDILFYQDKDCRNLIFTERRKYLQKFINLKLSDKITLSKLINFSCWKDLEKIRENSLSNHVEGVVVKQNNSVYKKGRSPNGWYKWKRRPFSMDFIIMYAQRGHGKRSSFYSDFTFGCWINKDFKELVPVGKAYSGYTNEELKKLDLWIRNNTLQRFGPVRSVKIGLIVEISFDNINFSSRHKSGVALRFPRFSKIRWDKHSSEVCTLKDVRDLIN